MIPIGLGLVVLIFHFAIVFAARSAVQAAAADGLRAAQIYGHTEADGEAAADHTLSLLGPIADNPTITVTKTNDRVTVYVAARIQSPIPWADTITATVEGPAERFYRPDERAG